jgi:hypothetical protein
LTSGASGPDASVRGRPAAVLALAFVLYGGATLAFWLYGGLAGAWRSPLLAALALPCGALALATGVLLHRRARSARIALLAWAATLLALNALGGGAAAPRYTLARVVAAGVGIALVLVLYRYIGRVCAQAGHRDEPPGAALVASVRGDAAPCGHDAGTGSDARRGGSPDERAG